MAILGSTTLTGCNSIPDFIASGSLMIFFQTSSPTSWTKQTVDNDTALRVVSGTDSSGGTIAFSSAFPSASTVPISSPVSISGSVGNTTLTVDQIPSHTHSPGGTSPATTNNPAPTRAPAPGKSLAADNTGSTGGSGAHTHPWSASPASVSLSTTVDLRVQYIDIIVASKD